MPQPPDPSRSRPRGGGARRTTLDEWAPPEAGGDDAAPRDQAPFGEPAAGSGDAGGGAPPPGAGRWHHPLGSPPPSGGNIYAWKFPFPPSPPPALAGSVGKVMAFLVVVIALVGLGIAVSSVLACVAGIAALSFGIAFGHLVPVDDWFKRLSGWVAALLVAVLYLTICAVIAVITKTFPPLEPAPYIGLAVAGMDWKRADRLRPSVFLSGLFLLPLIGEQTAESLLVALLWLGAALVTLWVLQGDTERGQRRAVPVQSSTVADGEELPLRGSELLRILGSAALISMALALLIGNPSCDTRDTRNNFGISNSDARYYDPSNPNSPYYDPDYPYGNGGGGSPYGTSVGGGRSGAGGGAGGASGGRGASGGGGYSGSGNENGSYDGGGNGGYGGSGNGGYGGSDGGSDVGSGGAGRGGQGSTGGGGQTSGGGSGTRESGLEPGSGSSRAASSAGGATDLTPLLYILLGIGVVIAAAAVVFMMIRKIADDEDDDELAEGGRAGKRKKASPSRVWGRGALARLVTEGERRGRPRRKAETISRYCGVLATSVLPDERVVGVGRVLDTALYGPREVSGDEMQWVDVVLEELAAMPTEPASDAEPATTV